MADSIEEQVLSAQAFGYAVCAVQSNALAIEDSLYGECGCEHDCRAMFYQWGVEIMNTTDAVDCDCNDKCVTAEFACATIKLLNPGCITCGCGNPDDVPFDCAIVQDTTVYQALDADQETVVPNVAGRTTLVISDLTDAGNDWADNVGSIGTDDGAGTFTWYLPPTSTIVLASATGVYYVTYPGGAGPLYPPIDGSQSFTTLILLSRFPAITLMYARTVVVEVSEDGVTWTPIYSGPETALAYGVTLTLPNGYLATDSRTTYFYGPEDECSFQYALGTIPPFVPPPCGVLVYGIVPTSTCATDNWTIPVTFTQIDGWGIGTITPTVNGVAGTAVPITLGTITFGPYIMGDLVTFDLTSNLDAACDITTQVYADPRVGEQDFTVLRAVDANEYATLSGDGEDYYIVSNVDNLVANWGLNVGSIWLGGSSTYQAVANLEIVYASNPGGALGFWQDDAGVPKRLFPQPLYTLNTVTLVSVVTLDPVAPFTQAWATLFMQALWTGPSTGSPDTVYNGTPGGFTTGSFTSATGSTVTGVAAYSDGCPVRVPALLATFTPDGDIDPDYVGLGVDNVVYDIVSQPGGGVIIVGAFIEYDPAGTPIPANGITRLDVNGVIDTAYNDIVNDPLLPATGQGRRGFSKENDLVGNPTCAAIAYAALKDSAGRVYVGGNFTHMNGVAASGIVRLLTDGSRDPSFTNPGVTYPDDPKQMFISGLAVDNVDRVVACGWFERCGSVFVGDTMRMLESNGTLDTGFNNNVRNGFFFRVPKVRYDATDDSFVYNSAQPPATTWDFGPAAAPAFPAPNANTAIVTPIAGPGGIPYSTGSITVRKTAVRLYGGNVPNCGKLKSIIALGAQFEEVAHPVTPNLAIQPDGKILFTGTFTYYAGTAANRIVRMDGMGGTDLTFEAGSGGGFNSGTSGVDLLPNGQVLVGSDLPGAVYTDSTAVPKNVLGLIRLNADGTADTAWDIGTGFDNFVTVAKVDDFGKVWVGGGFADFDGTTYNHIVKLL